MFYTHDIGWGWEFLMILGMVVFAGLVALGVVWLVRTSAPASAPPSPTDPSTESAIEILDRRLANGELSVEDYHERREAIRPGLGKDRASV